MLRRIDEAGTKGILRGLMDVVHAEFAEDVLAMGVDSVETGEALGSNLLGGHAKGNVFEDLLLDLGEVDRLGMTVSGLLLDEQLHGMLTDEPLAVHHKAKCLADLRQCRSA